MKNDDKHGVQEYVGETADDHKQEGTERIPDRAKHVRFHVQDQHRRNPKKVDPQIEHGWGQRVFGRPEEPEQNGGDEQTQDAQQYADQREDRDGIARGNSDVLLKPGSVDLRDDDRGPRRSGDKKADQEVDDLGRTAADGCQRDGADKAADNQSVKGII